MAKDRTISLDEADLEIDQRIAGTDQARAGALAGFAGVRQAKQNILQREKTRLSLKLGPDAPRIAALTAQIEVNQSLRSEVALETERAKTDVPMPTEGIWVLYGYVRDTAGNGVKGLTVGLFDPQGNWVRELGYTCTEANGHFKLETDNIAGTNGQVQLRLFDSQKQCIYMDKTPLTPSTGRVDYREIRLINTQPICPQPTPGPTTTPTPCPDPLPLPDDVWVVQGRITGINGQGLPNLIVTAYDKDFLFDDQLGSAETDANGYYRIVYYTQDFRILFERKPDLYLRITSASGHICYSTQNAIRHEAGRNETIDVTLPVDGASNAPEI
jgi:hypothetical protein